MKRKIIPISPLAVASILIALAFVVTFIAGGAGFVSAGPEKPPHVRSATSEAARKVHPHLQEVVASAQADEVISVIARVKAGTDLTPYFVGQVLVRPFVDPLGQTVAIGKVYAGNVYKMASVKEVSFIQLPESIVDLPTPPDPEVRFEPSAEQIQAAREALRSSAGAWTPAGQSGPQPSGWFDVAAGHKSSAAWAKGFTGKGVKVMVNDSGIDFAHPDLQATWAVVTDASSPYYGWPEMFDSYSMYLYVLDNFYGTTYVKDGLADYADTSFTCSASPCGFKPIGASAAHNYILTGTSQSGIYHIGSHPDTALQAWWLGERAAVLVVDEHTPGVYDTVYVDLNGNYNFTDDKPVTRTDPISWLDFWSGYTGSPPDGYADLSGGLVYFIADGVHPIPASDWLWGPFAPPPGNGDLVAFIINDPRQPAGDHGQLCASNVAAQGVIDGPAGAGAVKPAYKPAGAGGMVQGAGKEVGLVANGNFYQSPFIEDPFLFAALGYDGISGTEDDIQIISNSWGFSAIENDGWDAYSRLIDGIQRYLGPNLSVLVSTGNGAPGYGTVTSPNGPNLIGVGASTQMGSTGWDSAKDVDQITYGDVIPWSNRGPGARGDLGVHVVADGAFGSGDLALNEWGDGWTAYTTWGGTSRSSPVAAGNLALVYDAYKQATGVWPDFTTARAIFMQGATNLNYDPLVQGGGAVNADRATDIAAGLKGFYVLPEIWQVGDYRGVAYDGFASIIHPGESDSQSFTIYNRSATPLSVNLRSDGLIRIGEREFDFTSSDRTLEAPYNFNRPGYLLEIPGGIPSGTDLMIVRAVYPYDEWDTNHDYVEDNRWRLLVYDWKDQNGDGNLWVDSDGDGTVDVPELDVGEYMRFTYHYTSQNNKHVLVQRPLERSHDGLFIGLQHQVRLGPAVTHFHFRVEFYQHATFPWLGVSPAVVSVPAGGSATFSASVTVPGDAPYGMHEAAILMDDGTHVSVLPVLINVAAKGADFTFGGGPRSDAPYDNGQVFGTQDWSWRAESGDWRFYFVDLPQHSTLPEGQPFANHILIDTQWENAPFTDIDTIVMGPTPDCLSNGVGCGFPFGGFPGDPAYYGPYTLDIIGRSPNTNVRAGVWVFNTSSGGPREIISAPYIPGLNLIALHNVNFQGAAISEGVTGRVGTISVNPSPIDVVASNGKGANKIKVGINSSLPLSGLVVDAFGLGAPETFPDQVVKQDDPNNPSTASYTKKFTVVHGALLEVSTGGAPGNDIDLYLYDPTGKLAGSSTTPTDEEFVSVLFPMDGEWTIAVHGWSVPAGTATFDLTINAIQGFDLSVSRVPSGPIIAGRTYHFDLAWKTAGFAPGTYSGLVLLGPPQAPGAVTVPVTVTVR
jgi:hypothetical protein